MYNYYNTRHRIFDTRHISDTRHRSWTSKSIYLSFLCNPAIGSKLLINIWHSKYGVRGWDRGLGYCVSQFMLTLLRRCLITFLKIAYQVLNYQEINEVRSNSFRESHQHTDKQFDLL